MSDFWNDMKDCMDEDPIPTMLILFAVAVAMVTWIMCCIACPPLILFTIIVFATTFGLWKFCEWMISKNVKKGEIMKWYVCECEDNNIPFIVKEFDNREEAIKFLDDYLEFRERLYGESAYDLALAGNWYRVLNDDDLDEMDY